MRKLVPHTLPLAMLGALDPKATHPGRKPAQKTNPELLPRYGLRGMEILRGINPS